MRAFFMVRPALAPDIWAAYSIGVPALVHYLLVIKSAAVA